METNVSSSQKVAVFIDGGNVYGSQHETKGRLDFEKVLERLNHRNIHRAILYHPQHDEERERPFLRKIRGMGIEVKVKKVKKYEDGTNKADMDVDIAVDAISMADKVDVITIVSGDGDYCPLVNYLKARGVKTEAMGFIHNTSSELRQAVDQFYSINPSMFLVKDDGNSPSLM